MENLLNCKGRRFTAIINGTPVSGKIQVKNGELFLCQDMVEGCGCCDQLGYKFAWHASTDANGGIADHYDLRLVLPTPAEIESYKDWQVGDEISDGSHKWTVIFRSGKLVVCEDDRGIARNNLTCDELHRAGFRLKVDPEEIQPELTEITMDQIAEKFGVPVEKLKIKKN